MAGLNLNAGAQVKFGAPVNYGTVANPSSSMEAGFGVVGSNGRSQGLAALAPNDPAGIAFWVGVLTTGLLVTLYWSLPR